MLPVKKLSGRAWDLLRIGVQNSTRKSEKGGGRKGRCKKRVERGKNKYPHQEALCLYSWLAHTVREMQMPVLIVFSTIRAGSGGAVHGSVLVVGIYCLLAVNCPFFSLCLAGVMQLMRLGRSRELRE